MKKSLKQTTAIFLTVLMLFSTILVGTATTASAATLQTGDKIYLKPSSSWQIDGARFSVYFFSTGGGEFWYTMLPSSQGSGIYEAVVPDGSWDRLIFCRMNGGTTDNNWDNRWNQTGDLEWDGYNNCYTTWDDQWDGDIGSWSYINDEVVTNPTTAPTTKPTTTPTSKPTTAPTTEATDPTEADEDQFLYVSAKSNLSSVGVKTKTTGDLITVTYTLKADQLIDGGQATITYDAEKVTLSSLYNTAENMFPTVKSVAYNLSSDKGEAMFNFSSLNNDFTNGAVFVNLVFERKNRSVGTARVNLNVTDLASQNTTYVEDSVVNSTTGLSLTAVVSEKEYTTPTKGTVATDATQNLDVRVSTNLSDGYTEVKVDKANVKVTFKLTAQEAIAFGNGTVTFDEGFLALEDRFNTNETIFTTVSSGTSYNLNAASGTMKFAFTGVDAANNKGLFDFSKGGELVTLVFTVKSGASGIAHIRLNVENLGSMSKDYVADFAVVDTVSVEVNGEAQQATASSTDPTSTPIATGEVPTTDPKDTTDTTPTATSDTTPTSSDTNPTETTPNPTTTDPTETTKPTESTVAENVGPGVKAEDAEKVILGADDDDDLKGSDFRTLAAKQSKAKKKSIKIVWNKNSEAAKYVVYGAKCGSDYKKLKTVKGTSFTQKKLKKGTYYKYLIVAVDDDGKVISTSKTLHIATSGNKKKANPTGVKTQAANDKVTIKVKKSFKLKAKTVVKKGTTVKEHRKIKYETSNSKIAKVTKKGVIKAKKKGTCYVYAYAQNGICKKIKVTVKK